MLKVFLNKQITFVIFFKFIDIENTFLNFLLNFVRIQLDDSFSCHQKWLMIVNFVE